MIYKVAPIFALSFLCSPIPGDAAEVEIRLQLDAVKVIENGPFRKSAFERDRYFRSYHPLGQFSDERHAELEAIGAVPGRATFGFQLEPDPKPARTFTEDSIRRMIEQRDAVYRKAGERASHLEHALAHGHYPEWMRPGFGPPPEGVALEDWERQSHGNIIRPDLYESVADVIVRWYDEFKRKGLHYPVYYTVQNEPISSWKVEDFSRYTHIVADRMQASHPDVQVAGPCLAWPYPTSDWSGWRNWQSRFIDLAGDAVDTYDLHFYSKGHWALPHDDHWDSRRVDSPFLLANCRQGNKTVWDFGRLPGHLDLWNAHHLDVWNGETKPMIVSEFGRQTIHPQFGPWKNDFWAWLYMTTVTRMWMVFMDRPEVLLTIPFILPESDAPYAPSRGQAIYTRLDAPESLQLTVTRFREFYAFFRDFDGIRIPFEAVSEDPSVHERLFVLPLREGNHIYVLIHNGGSSLEDVMTVDLDTMAGGEQRTPQNLSVKRLYYEGRIPEPKPGENERPAPGTLFIAGPEDYESMSSPELTLRGEEIAIVRLDFDDSIPAISHTRREIRHYSRDTLVSLAGNGRAEGYIKLPDPLPENLLGARLHLGLARDGGFDQNPDVAFNDTRLPPIQLEHTAGVADYHAPSVVKVPVEAIQDGSNRVRVAFSRRIEGGSPYLVSIRLDLIVGSEGASK